MKTIWKYMTLAAAAAFMAACQPTYPEIIPGDVPQASNLDVTITVDQETNYATFVMNTEGVVPVWIFGDQLIDGKASKRYSYTANGLSLRFRDAGEHTVEVKAYNKNGISQGSIVKTFKMDNTYRDPFDPSPYVRNISGGSSVDWIWNSSKDGHFGCGWVYTDAGEYAPNPLGWWSCGANGKADFLYNDTMTFTSDGQYTFDPGDGQAYAKHDAEYPAGHATEADDYLFPAEKSTTKYTFENNWNAAGIEEIFLVLERGSILSYVPHKDNVENPRFQVLETKSSEMRKTLKLMAIAYTPDNKAGISYYYEFIPKGSAADEGDPLFGKDSRTWVLDNETSGYMGCGESVANPTNWWSANPHDKDGFGVADDEITFFKDGKYTFNPGADGKIYCNWESGYHSELWSGVSNDDYDAPAEAQESTYTLGSDADGDYIELPAGIFFGYVPNKAVLDTPTRLYIKENTQDRLVLVAKFDGISWQMIFRPKEGQDISGGGEPASLEEALVGSWTWDADVKGHFGCGPNLGDPLSWWSGDAHCKDDASMYDDVMTFTADGQYTLDPVDGMTYINKDVTVFDDRKVDSPYGDDFRIRSEKTTLGYELDEDGDFEVIKLSDGAIFSYVPNNDFVDEPYLYVRSYTKDQLVLMSFNGGIAWQFILKRVN